MNTTQKEVTLLLRSAITGQALSLPEEFSPEALLPELKGHHISSLIYAGLLNCGFPQSHPVMAGLFQSYCKSLVISERQLAAVSALCRRFDGEGIDYMPLKGCNMKELYPKPELRMMGDADILIRQEQYERIIPLLQELGYARKYESDHELVWACPALELELHKHLIPSYNRELYRYFGSGWQFAAKQTGCRWSMTAEDEWVYLFTHFAKHYRDGGVGCRHVTDLWVWLRAHPELDDRDAEEKLARLQLLEFYRNIRRLLTVWFEDAPSDDKMDYLTETIFASGSWGSMESQVLSRAVRDAKVSPLGFNGRLLYLWQTLFPSRDMLREKYSILNKAPWVLPAVWLVRPFYKLLFERDTLGRHEKGLETLSGENLETRRKLLNYVGLDYHT